MSWSLFRILRASTEAGVEALLASLTGALANPQDTSRLVWCDTEGNFRWLDDMRVIQTDLSYTPAAVREGCQAYIMSPSAARTIDVSSASSNIGAAVYIRNLGATYSITFKQTASISSTIGPGQFAMFMWNGASWDLIYGTSAPPPIGYAYIQGVNDASPGTLWPGTTWSDVSSEEAGRFRRIKGTYTPPNGGTMGLATVGATQDHAGQGHIHQWSLPGYTSGGGVGLVAGQPNPNTINTGEQVIGSHGAPQIDYENRPAAVGVAKWRRTA